MNTTITQRTFPIRDYDDEHRPLSWSVPFAMLEAHEAQFTANHGGTLETIARTIAGGLQPFEVLAAMRGEPLPWEAVSPTGNLDERAARRREARVELRRLADAWTAEHPVGPFTARLRVVFRLGTTEREGVIPVTPEEIAGFRANGITGGLVGIRVLSDENDS